MLKICIQMMVLMCILLVETIQIAKEFIDKLTVKKGISKKRLKTTIALLEIYLIGISLIYFVGINNCSIIMFLVQLVIMVFILGKISINILNLEFNKKIYKDYYIAWISVIFSLILIVLLYIEPNKNKSYIIFGIVIIDMLLIWLVVRLQNIRYLESEHTHEIEQIKAQQQYINEVKKMNDEVKCFRHDIKKHCDVLKQLLMQNNTQQALEYLGEYTDRVMKSIGQLKTGNDSLDALINTRVSLCYQNKIPFSVIVDYKLYNVDSVNICTIIGNLIDNAIEYSLCIPENKRYIELRTYKDKDDIMVIVKNAITESVMVNNKEFKTNKKDKNSHGIGTKIVKDIVKKNYRSIEYYEKYNMFICKITL